MSLLPAPPQLILLDRDGVLNQDTPTGVVEEAQFHWLDGALEAIAELTDAGLPLAIVTNQSAIGKGWMTEDTLQAIHTTMLEDIHRAGGAINRIYYCSDAPDKATHRRKPAPGMLLEALHDFDAPPERTLFIGDAERDLQAAQHAGCHAILVQTGKGAQTLQKGLAKHLTPLAICSDIKAASALILKELYHHD